MKLSDLITGDSAAPPTKTLKLSDVQNAAEQPSLLGNALKPLADIPGDIGAEFSAGREMARSGIQEGGITGVLKAIGGGVMEAFSPITGATKALVGDPIRANLPKGRTGELVAEGAEDVASMFGPGVVAKGARAVGKALPGVSKEAGALMSEGVELTPGQITGGIPRRAEEAFKSFPILGSFIRKAEGRSIESFNRAVINQSLAPISRKLPEDTAVGHDAIAYADRQFDDAYNRLKSRITFRSDQKFLTDLADIRQRVNELPPQLQQQWEQILANRLAGRMAPNATMTGDKFKEAESDLGRLAAQYRSSPDPAQRGLAHALDETKLAIRSALARTNPAEADTLKAINEGYAMLVRAEGAAARRATSQGIFTPSDLLQTIKTADSSVRKRDFARGDALMQDFSEAAHKVLGNKLPDSGTTERALWDVGGGLGAFAIKPEIPMALGAGSLPYTATGTRLINQAVKAGPRVANRGLNALEQTGPLSVLSQQAGSYGALSGRGQQ